MNSEQPRQRLAQKSVLLVESVASIRNHFAMALRAAGYLVTEAIDGYEALHLTDPANAPDLVVADDDLPGMSGAELALCVRQKRPGLPALVLFTSPDRFGLLRANLSGVACRLKPSEPALILPDMAALLARV